MSNMGCDKLHELMGVHTTAFMTFVICST